MELHTPTCALRAFRPTDAASLAHHANNRAIGLTVRDVFPHPYTLADADAYIALVADEQPVMSFAIEVDGAAVGGISLRRGTDVERQMAEIGYWLGESYWRRGIATAAVRAVTAYAFRDLDLLRVVAIVFAHNPASVRVLERAGYVREGVMRRSAVKDGVVIDRYLYAALRPETPSPRDV
jgi:[ribosomal protein S5]-alanine N-acetyltransferase